MIGLFTAGNNIEKNNSNIYVFNPSGELPPKHADKITSLDSDKIIRENCGFSGKGSKPSLEEQGWDNKHEINVKY